MRPFSQVDVFGAEPLRGNPVAVVLDGDGLSEDRMRGFARWTNLSETTFVLPPTDPAADYRVRIFTPGTELPFAGHPTLGTAHAWLEAGGVPADPDRVVQQCAAGLVPLRRTDRLAFAAPPLVRSGPVDHDDVRRIAAALRIDLADVVATQWIDNGPGWVGVQLRDAAAVLALEPDPAEFGGLEIGVVGLRTGADTACEVRAFGGGLGISEDPVTGSLNAGLAQWLIPAGVLPASYVAAQGTALRRAGRVHVEQVGDTVWVGGNTVTTVSGHADLGE